MTLKVHLYPAAGDGSAAGGIPRVVEAQYRHLPRFGIELVPTPEQAEVIATHVTLPGSWATKYPRTPIVSHNHGLYWTEIPWPEKWDEVNRQAMAAARASDVITAPSEWVAQSLRRATSRDVRVVPHGIDLEAWPFQEQPGEGGGYVLWNKARVDPVCDPEVVTDLAKRMPEVRFVTTFSERRFSLQLADHPSRAPNMTVTGQLPFPEAQRWVRNAGVFLATVRETFGIGTLEAMASGVPIVGYRFGGHEDFVTHGVDGWLVEPGDVAGLAAGIREVLARRPEYSRAARATAERFTWDVPAEQYAAIYHELAERARAERAAPRTSVVVPAYNMGDYLGDALASVQRQTDRDLECIVYIDASPDPRDLAIASEVADRDPRFRVLVGDENLYLAGARNRAIEAARGRYVLPLDADDQLDPRAVATLADALDGDRELSIAYGVVHFVEEDGRTPTDYGTRFGPGRSGWPPQFEARQQLSEEGYNLIPVSSMYRRSTWQALGGYRRRWRTHEDADFWTRATSYGFVARRVTEAPTLIYRNRAGSMSRVETKARTWPRWYPWIAHPELRPGACALGGSVPSFAPPEVSVVIPVGPGHDRFVLDAVDSVDAQTYRWWECIVINDSGQELPPLPSWVRVVDNDEHRFGGVAAARNAGVRAARAARFVPLDADDFLMPPALELLVAAARLHPDEVIYPDFFEDPTAPNVWQVYETAHYQPERLTSGLGWAVTQIIPVAAWERVGGYDEELPAWEDWGFQMALAAEGICSRRLAAPLFAYRKHSGFRRSDNLQNKDKNQAAFLAKWGRYFEGEQMAACRRCGSGAGSTMQPQHATQQRSPSGDAVLIEYVGARAGARMPYRGRATGTQYYFLKGQPVYVHETDAARFLESADFARVAQVEGLAAADENGQPLLTADGPPSRAAAPV